jgi:hypothetical protein
MPEKGNWLNIICTMGGMEYEHKFLIVFLFGCFLFCLSFLFCCAGDEPRASHIVVKYCTSELHPLFSGHLSDSVKEELVMLGSVIM